MLRETRANKKVQPVNQIMTPNLSNDSHMLKRAKRERTKKKKQKKERRRKKNRLKTTENSFK